MKIPANKVGGSGFTIVEVTIAGSIMAILLMVALGTFGTANDHLGQAMVVDDLSHRATQLEERLRQQLASAGNMDLDDNTGGLYRRVNYHVVEGYNFGNKTPLYSSTQYSIRWVAADYPGAPSGTGKLEVLAGGSSLYELARDVRGSDFQIEFYRSDGALGGNTDQNAAEIRISFTLLGRVGRRPDGTVEMREERRVVRISLRNV